VAEAVAPPQPFKLVRPSFGLVLLLGAINALPPMAIDMYLPSLPAIARSYGAHPGAAQVTIATFLAGLAIGQFVYGPVSDRLGRRGPMLFGASLFLIGTLACIFAPTLPMLAAARFVQALGGSAGQVVGRAVVRDRFDHRNAARVLSLLMLVWGMAPVVAPLLGSLIIVVAPWQVVFWVQAALGAVILAGVVFGLKESRSAETAAHARSEHPIRAYVALLGNPALVGYVLAFAFNSAAIFAYISAAPGLLEGHYGVSPVYFGWVFSANSVALVAMGQVNARLLHHYTPEQIIRLARPATLVVAVLMALSAVTGVGGMWGVLVPLFFVIGSFGFFGANTQAAGLNVDPRRAGSISALMGGAGFIIGSLSSAAVAAAHDTGPVPMALVVLCAIGLSTLSLYALAKPSAAAARA